jgi:hypothetical protein
LKDGLIQRDYDSKAGSKADCRICYKLTEAGHDLCRKTLGLDHTYHAQSPAHDLRIAEKYLILSPEEQATWRNESAVREEIAEQIRSRNDCEADQDLKSGKLSPPDAVYTASDGVETAFEVITSNLPPMRLLPKWTRQSIWTAASRGYEYERPSN